jgi:hypothetical protein
MGRKSTKSNHLRGRFSKGKSGNPRGRPKGSTGHAAELRRLEEDALKLAVNVVDVIAETTRLALAEIERQELIPLFDAITDATKDAVKAGEVGPSSIALLRSWYDDHIESPSVGAFFTHVGLPCDCSWEAFSEHYTHRGRVDYARHATDLTTYPPVARRIKSLTEEAA